MTFWTDGPDVLIVSRYRCNRLSCLFLRATSTPRRSLEKCLNKNSGMMWASNADEVHLFDLTVSSLTTRSSIGRQCRAALARSVGPRDSILSAFVLPLPHVNQPFIWNHNITAAATAGFSGSELSQCRFIRIVITSGCSGNWLLREMLSNALTDYYEHCTTYERVCYYRSLILKQIMCFVVMLSQ